MATAASVGPVLERPGAWTQAAVDGGVVPTRNGVDLWNTEAASGIANTVRWMIETLHDYTKALGTMLV